MNIKRLVLSILITVAILTLILGATALAMTFAEKGWFPYVAISIILIMITIVVYEGIGDI